MEFAAILSMTAKIIGGLATLLGTMFAIYKFVTSKRGEENKWYTYMENISKVYTRLHDIRASYGADRVTMFLLTDSGSIPAPGIPLFLSSMYEARLDNTIRSMRESFNRRPVMESQVDQLLKLALDKKVSLKFEDVNFDDQEIWRAYRVEKRDLIELISNDGSYIYLAIDNIKDDVSPEDNESVRVAILDIQSILNNKPSKILATLIPSKEA